MEYSIKTQIIDDQLIAIIVTDSNGKEAYISDYELKMMCAEWCWANGKFHDSE